MSDAARLDNETAAAILPEFEGGAQDRLRGLYLFRKSEPGTADDALRMIELDLGPAYALPDTWREMAAQSITFAALYGGGPVIQIRLDFSVAENSQFIPLIF